MRELLSLYSCFPRANDASSSIKKTSDENDAAQKQSFSDVKGKLFLVQSVCLYLHQQCISDMLEKALCAETQRLIIDKIRKFSQHH